MKKKLKTMIIISMIITLILGGLIFVNDAFLPASILWLSLTSFEVCYYIKDTDKKKLYYGLFIFGILLIILAIWYTVKRVS